MYCTLQDIRNVIDERTLINLTNDVPFRQTQGIEQPIDADRFEAVSLDADSLINGYLRARYKLPLKNVPALIKTIAIDICAYRLYSRRSVEIPEHITENYKQAKKDLENIQKGNILLETITEDEETGVQSPKTGFRCNKTKKDKIFTDLLLDSYRTL